MTVPPTPPAEKRYSLRLPPRTLLILAGVWIVPAVLEGLQRYLKQSLDNRQGVDWSMVAFQSAAWLALVLLTPIPYFMAQRFPLRRASWSRTIGTHLVGVVALCIAWATVGLFVEGTLIGRTQDLIVAYRNWIFTTAPGSLVMYFAILAVVQALTYFAEARERETQVSRLAAQLAEARLDALRQQLNPHFLFNSLNAITVLVREQDTRAASRVLELLSDLLRQVLRAEQPHEVPLSQELNFVEQYLAIEKVRFPHRLRVDMAIDEGVRDSLVPTFILQPLVENAIRHGVARRADAGRITISAQRDAEMLRLSVKDDGAGLAGDARHDGVGLSNTRERLRTLYDGMAALSIVPLGERGTEVSIVMPYRWQPS